MENLKNAINSKLKKLQMIKLKKRIRQFKFRPCNEVIVLRKLNKDDPENESYEFDSIIQKS